MKQLKGLKGLDTGNKAGNVLNKLNTMKEYDMDYIPYEKIRRSEKNDYPMEREMIDALKRSILSPSGLINNLDVVKIEEDPDNYEYELLSGEQRFTAIGELINEGYDVFRSGIPCKVYPKTMDADEREIALIEANELTRDSNPERRRKKLKRLEELYQKKNYKNSDITKELAGTTGMGIRQIQRYRTVNNNLIPELQQALDESKMSLESAANIASLPENLQQVVLEFLISGQAKSKEEIDILQKQLKERSEELDEIKNSTKGMEESVKKAEQDLYKKMKDLEREQEELVNLKNQVDNNELSEEQKNEYEEKLRQADIKSKEISDDKKRIELENDKLRKKIEEMERAKKKEKTKIEPNQEELQRIKLEYEFDLISNNVLKDIKKLKEESQKYNKFFGNNPKNLDNVINEMKSLFNISLNESN